MDGFLENPFLEGELEFTFPAGTGAARYEQWAAHVRHFQRLPRKAADFLYPADARRELFITEIKDYATVSVPGKAGYGEYGPRLATVVAQKITDTVAGLREMPADAPAAERDFAARTATYARVGVFPWEFHHSVPEHRINMALMKTKLRQLLHGVCARVAVENISDSPAKQWSVKREGRKQP